MIKIMLAMVMLCCSCATIPRTKVYVVSETSYFGARVSSYNLGALFSLNDCRSMATKLHQESLSKRSIGTFAYKCTEAELIWLENQ